MMDTFLTLENLSIANEYMTIRQYQESNFAQLEQIFDTNNLVWFSHKYNKLSDFLQEKLIAYKNKTSVTYVFIDNGTNKIVGTSSLYDINLEHKRLEIGATWFGSMYKGKYYNSMSKMLLLQFLFEDLEFNLVQFKTDKLNYTSRIAMEKNGFHFDGIFRNHIITHNGRVRDSMYFSVIKSEWNKTKQHLQERIKQKL